jgi:hypothetical protein
VEPRASYDRCEVRTFAGDDRGEIRTQDWDPGFEKLECGPGMYAAGISARPVFGVGNILDGLLCCGAPEPAPLRRWYSHETFTHRVTTRGWKNAMMEQEMGYLFSTPGADRSPLYDCVVDGSNYFLSPDPNCEGAARVGTALLGYLHSGPTATSRALYRCRYEGGHVATFLPGCEGLISEGILGYLESEPQPQPLARWLHPGGFHHATNQPVPDAQFEGVYGYLHGTPAPDRVALYECQAGNQHPVSLHANCEGAFTLVRRLGYLQTNPEGGTQAIYRCYAPTLADYMISTDPLCESPHYHSEGLLGYAPVLPPAAP